MFTPGNLVTMGVCLLVVLLFRQLDKNNRSLEKVKKYTDKIKGELEQFIKDRVDRLNDAALGLDVQQTKAVAAVKRLDAIREDVARKEADLAERSGMVDGIERKIKEYEQTLKTLEDMTARAETNLERLADESGFTEMMGKKLGEAQKQLGALTAEIPVLREQFLEENRRQLSSVQEDVLSSVSKSIDDIGRRVEAARHDSEKVLEHSAEKLQELVKKSLAEAARRADSMEEATFVKLKEQALDRLSRYKETIEEKTTAIQEMAKEKVGETQQLVKNFRAEWQTEAHDFLETTRAEIAELTRLAADASDRLEKELRAAGRRSDQLAEELSARVHELESHSSGELSRLEAEMNTFSTAADTRLADMSKTIDGGITGLKQSFDSGLSKLQTESDSSINSVKTALEKALLGVRDTAAAALVKQAAEFTASIDRQSAELSGALAGRSTELAAALEKLAATLEQEIGTCRSDVDYRLNALRTLIEDTDRLEETLRAAWQETAKTAGESFNAWAAGQSTEQERFSGTISTKAAEISDRMAGLEAGLNELKSKAYANVSEKLKLFEDDFFADLTRRSDSVNTALVQWQHSLDERLESLGAAGESARKDLETKYTLELTNRLQEIGEQFRDQTGRVEEQIQAVEAELRGRISVSDKTLNGFLEQIRSDFAELRTAADAQLQKELAGHAAQVQESLRRQERDIEVRARALEDTVEQARGDAGGALESIRQDFAQWQQRTVAQLDAASGQIESRLADLSSGTESSITALESAYTAQYKAFLEKASQDRALMQQHIEQLGSRMDQASADFAERSGRMLAELTRNGETFSAEQARQFSEASTDTDAAVRGLKTMVQDVRDKLEQAQSRVSDRIQSEAAALNKTLDEIDRRQKAFVAQTRVFDRADELKQGLEKDLAELKDEIGRLDVYRETMSSLEQHYIKTRKMEEEATAKLNKFMAEKKRIDILEADFTKLLGLSESIDRKISELTLTNDDMQQYQVQIRRFEESITAVNSRYERLEKKAAVLDQTVDGVDKAFENLKNLESAIGALRSEFSSVPGQLDSVQSALSILMENRGQLSRVVDRISGLDDILSDVETRTERMQTAREWLAKTETRLEEISRQAEDQLKLLGDLLKDEGASRKTKGAPPIGIRENVVKLSRQGWKVDEIARALHLSRGEVELILELPQK